MSRSVSKALAALAAFAFFGMFSTSGENVVPALRGTFIEAPLVALGYPNTILFNICIGYLVSLFFWILVVYLPERKRRSILRSNLNRRYQRFKEEIIQSLLWASIGMHDSRKPRELSDYLKFKEFFSQNNSEHWYAALNGIQSSEDRMREITLAMQMLADEVNYVLNNLSIDDEAAHTLLKNLNENVYRLQHSGADLYDQVKHVGGFLWIILARWRMLEGQLEEDVVQNVIDRL